MGDPLALRQSSENGCVEAGEADHARLGEDGEPPCKLAISLGGQVPEPSVHEAPADVFHYGVAAAQSAGVGCDVRRPLV